MTKFTELEKICKNCTKCDLHKTRKNVVFGRGNPKADILFIGEAPGNKEDVSGEPFVGAAGKQLSKQLENAKIDESKIYIANILKCRPPNNRNPKQEEIKLCTPFLVEQIKLINPKIICTLGNYSTKFILSNFNPNEMKQIKGISELHGKKHKINNRIVIPLYHPAATLYRHQLKQKLEKDLKKINSLLKSY